MAFLRKSRADITLLDICQGTCGMLNPCGNRFCSNHPRHYEVKGKQPFEKPHRFRHKKQSYYI